MRIRFYQTKYSLRVIISAALLCLIAGCGTSSIVGKWRMSGSEATVWEFKSNGAVLVGDVTGKYKFGDQDRIKVLTPPDTAVHHAGI